MRIIALIFYCFPYFLVLNLKLSLQGEYWRKQRIFRFICINFIFIGFLLIASRRISLKRVIEIPQDVNSNWITAIEKTRDFVTKF